MPWRNGKAKVWVDGAWKVARARRAKKIDVKFTTIATSLTEPNNERPYQEKVAVDSNGNIWLCFNTKISGSFETKVYYSSDGGNTFTDKNFPTNSSYDWTRSFIILGTDGTPYVFFQGRNATYSAQQIQYSKWNGSSWSSLVVVQPDSINKNLPSVAIDSNGDLHLVCDRLNGATFEIVYSKFSSGAWSAWEVVQTQGIQPSIDLDSDNKVHIVYMFFGDNKTVKYVTNKTGSWVVSDVYANSTRLIDASIKMCNSSIVIFFADRFGDVSPLQIYTSTSGSGVNGTVGNLQGTPLDLITSNWRPHFSLDGSGNYYLTFFSNINGVTSVSYIKAPAGRQSSKEIIGNLTPADNSHVASLYKDGALYGFYIKDNGDVIFFKRQTKNDWVQVPNIKYFT